MDDKIRIERLPGTPPRVRENGKTEDDKERRKKRDPDRSPKKSEISDGHVDTVALPDGTRGDFALKKRPVKTIMFNELV